MRHRLPTALGSRPRPRRACLIRKRAVLVGVTLGGSSNEHLDRPRVGVVLDGFASSYQSRLLESLQAASRARQAELWVFPGGRLGSTRPGSQERNTTYRLLRPGAALDGLVLLGSTITSDVGEMQRFCDRLRPLPMCSIGQELAGVPSVLPDNRAGMRALVRHLLAEHGLRRLAFIGGPNGNQESRERLEAFREELNAHGLNGAAAPNIEGDFLIASGREAARELLAHHPLGLDAIVAANDYMAMGVLEVLSTRSSPQDRRIAVTGFDNIDAAAFTIPMLTTVEQPLQRLAEAALSRILGEREGSAEVERVDTRLWVRRSCGCKEPLADRLPERPSGAGSEPLTAFLDRRLPQLGAELQRASEGLFGRMPGWGRHLVDSFAEQLRGIPGEPFTSAVDRMLTVLLEKRVDVWRFHDVIGVFRAAVAEGGIGDAETRLWAEDSLHGARLMISAAAMRAQARRYTEMQQTQRTLNELGARLSSCRDPASLRAALDESLPSVGLRRAYVLLGAGTRSDGTPLARPFYALGQPEVDDSRPFVASELLPHAARKGTSPPGATGSWVVLPLCARGLALGFAVLELRGHDGASYEALRLHLSAALANVLPAREREAPSPSRRHRAEQ